MPDKNHQLLTGPVNSGKSTQLWQMTQDTIKQGKTVSGWVSLPYFKDNKKEGYDIIFIQKNKVHPKQRFIRNKNFEQAWKWKHFYFDQSKFSLARSLDFGKPDLFIMDEVGPLELENHKGFWPALSKIFSQHDATCTVIRKHCLTHFCSLFPDYDFFITGHTDGI